MLWISEYKRDLLKSIYNTEWTKLYQGGPSRRKWIEWTELDRIGPNRTKVNRIGQRWTEMGRMDWMRPNWTTVDQIDQIRLNGNEVDQMDQTRQNGPNWTKVGQGGLKWEERTDWDWIGQNKTKWTELTEVDQVDKGELNRPNETKLHLIGLKWTELNLGGPKRAEWTEWNWIRTRWPNGPN